MQDLVDDSFAEGLDHLALTRREIGAHAAERLLQFLGANRLQRRSKPVDGGNRLKAVPPFQEQPCFLIKESLCFPGHLLAGFLIAFNNFLQIIDVVGLDARDSFHIRINIAGDTDIDKSQ